MTNRIKLASNKDIKKYVESSLNTSSTIHSHNLNNYTSPSYEAHQVVTNMEKSSVVWDIPYLTLKLSPVMYDLIKDYEELGVWDSRDCLISRTFTNPTKESVYLLSCSIRTLYNNMSNLGSTTMFTQVLSAILAHDFKIIFPSNEFIGSPDNGRYLKIYESNCLSKDITVLTNKQLYSLGIPETVALRHAIITIKGTFDKYEASFITLSKRFSYVIKFDRDHDELVSAICSIRLCDLIEYINSMYELRSFVSLKRMLINIVKEDSCDKFKDFLI